MTYSGGFNTTVDEEIVVVNSFVGIRGSLRCRHDVKTVFQEDVCLMESRSVYILIYIVLYITFCVSSRLISFILTYCLHFPQLFLISSNVHRLV